MGVERLLHPSRERLKQNDSRTSRLRFSQPSGRLLSLSVLRTKVFRSIIACKTFYRQTCAKTSPILLFWPCRITSAHFTTGSSSRPLMKLTHIMSNFLLNHIVPKAAKTFGKSQKGKASLPDWGNKKEGLTQHLIQLFNRHKPRINRNRFYCPSNIC
jgi:hypothetical protein